MNNPRSSHIAVQQVSEMSSNTPRRSPRIAEKNRLAEIKKRMADYKPPAKPRVIRNRPEVKVQYYNCRFDTNTGTWISEKVDYDSDC